MKNLIFAAVFMLSGCATQVGQPITEQKTMSLTEGETTKQEAIARFGRPYSTVRKSDGSQVLMWLYANAGLWGAQESQGLTITFDENEVVESYTASSAGSFNR